MGKHDLPCFTHCCTQEHICMHVQTGACIAAASLYKRAADSSRNVGVSAWHVEHSAQAGALPGLHVCCSVGDVTLYRAPIPQVCAAKGRLIGAYHMQHMRGRRQRQRRQNRAVCDRLSIRNPSGMCVRSRNWAVAERAARHVYWPSLA